MFWSGEILKSEISKLLFDGEGKPINDISKIDCSAYTLTVGPEAFVTPDGEATSETTTPIIDLSKVDSFKIPTGQFAFLLTEEIVKVPNDAIAFISFKASYKFKGLINVSGFHVDPGWNGRLLFSLFNAGPQSVLIRRGDPFALIWYSDLKHHNKDALSGFSKNFSQSQNLKIPADKLDKMCAEVFSPMVVKGELEKLREEIRKAENTFRQYFLGSVIAAAIAIVVSILGRYIYDVYIVPHVVPSKVEQSISSPSTLEPAITKAVPVIALPINESSEKILQPLPASKDVEKDIPVKAVHSPTNQATGQR